MNKIIAHRGNSWNYPENSWASILDAYQKPYCDGAEVDIRMTKDGKLIVSHYMNLFLTTRKPINICNMTLQELGKIEVSCDWWDHILYYWENKIQKNPYNQINLEKLKRLKKLRSYFITLEEALQFLPDDKELIIEVKGGEEDYTNGKFEDTIYQVLRNQVRPNVVVKGYNTGLCLRLKEKLPDLTVGTLVDKDTSSIVFPFDFVSINSRTLNPQVLESCYGKNGRPLYVWTINRLYEYLKLFELFAIDDVPNIITNHPEMISFFEEERKKVASVSELTDLLIQDAPIVGQVKRKAYYR